MESSYQSSNIGYDEVFEKESKWVADHTVPARLHRIYEYWYHKGYLNIVLSRSLGLLTLLFVYVFLFFLALCVDFATFSVMLSDVAVNRTVVVAFEDVVHSPHIDSAGEVLFMIVWVVCLLYWLYQLYKLARHAQEHWDTREFYQTQLLMSTRDVQAASWNDVMDQLVQPHIQVTLSREKHLDQLDIVNILMRRENYLISLLNREILDLCLPWPFPQTPVLTKAMEWGLRMILLDFIFSEDGGGVRAQVRDARMSRSLASNLRYRFRLWGVFGLIISPIVLIGVLIYFFFRYGEQVKNRPGEILSREWSPLARWRFRDLNELPHQFEERIKHSYKPAYLYVAHWNAPTVVTIARFASFLLGAVAVTLVVGSIVNDDFLFRATFFGKSAAFLLMVIAALLALFRQMIPNEQEVVPAPKDSLFEVAHHIHSVPTEWIRDAHTLHVQREFLALFSYRPVQWIEELVSFIVAPLIIIFSLPKCSEEIVEFFRVYTVDQVGIGSVCRYALFDVGALGNPKFAAPVSQTAMKQFDERSEGGLSELKVQSGGGSSGNGDTGGSGGGGTVAFEVDSDEEVAPSFSSFGEAPSLSASILGNDRETSELFPLNASAGTQATHQSRHGKLEASLLNFATEYPSWNPSGSLGPQLNSFLNVIDPNPPSISSIAASASPSKFASPPRIRPRSVRRRGGMTASAAASTSDRLPANTHLARSLANSGYLQQSLLEFSLSSETGHYPSTHLPPSPRGAHFVRPPQPSFQLAHAPYPSPAAAPPSSSAPFTFSKSPPSPRSSSSSSHTTTTTTTPFTASPSPTYSSFSSPDATLPPPPPLDLEDKSEGYQHQGSSSYQT